MRRHVIRTLAVIGIAGLLAGCGFKLRGAAPLPFASAYVESSSAVLSTLGTSTSLSSQRIGSQLGPLLRTALQANHKLAADKESAAIIINLTNEVREKSILSLSGAGKVREYRLAHRVKVSAVNNSGREVLAPSLLQLNRDFSYSDEQIMAKEAEEALLQKEMEQDLLRQILRRLGNVQGI
jgi:LPS-assembly lipoprotein